MASSEVTGLRNRRFQVRVLGIARCEDFSRSGQQPRAGHPLVCARRLELSVARRVGRKAPLCRLSRRSQTGRNGPASAYAVSVLFRAVRRALLPAGSRRLHRSPRAEADAGQLARHRTAASSVTVSSERPRQRPGESASGQPIRRSRSFSRPAVSGLPLRDEEGASRPQLGRGNRLGLPGRVL